MMRCVFCKETLEEKTSAFTVELDERIVVVKNVPSHVCSQCGEVSYSDDVYRELEKVVEQFRDTITEVAIVNYLYQAV